MLPSPTPPKIDLHGVNLTYYLLPTTYYLLSCYLLILTPTTLRRAETDRAWRLRAVVIFGAILQILVRTHSRYESAPQLGASPPRVAPEPPFRSFTSAVRVFLLRRGVVAQKPKLRSRAVLSWIYAYAGPLAEKSLGQKLLSRAELLRKYGLCCLFDYAV